MIQIFISDYSETQFTPRSKVTLPLEKSFCLLRSKANILKFGQVDAMARRLGGGGHTGQGSETGQLK